MNEIDKLKDEVDLLEILTVLWDNKIKITVLVTFFAIASVVYSLSIPNQYKASTTLAISDTINNKISPGIGGQLGGLASLAGVNVSSGQSTRNEQIALEIMQSWSFIETFISDNDIAPDLFSASGWNESKNELVYDKNIYNFDDGKWQIDPPTSWDLFQAFKGILSISQDSKTGLIYVSIEFYSPRVAKKWLDLYVDSINKHMQERKMLEVTRNITYLEDEILKTSVSEMREVFYSIIQEQTKEKMLAAVSPQYAFIAVNPSMIPQEKSKPRRSFICIVGTLFGAFISILFVLMRRYGFNIS